VHATTAANLSIARAKCTTCQEAFIAPTAEVLASQLQSIIDQGASDGDFTAQQSITESVFEYVDRVTSGAPPAVKRFDARTPSDRYRGIVPTRFVSSFTLPGFRGQLKAYQDDGSGNSVEVWSAGDKLRLQLSTAMVTCSSGARAGRRTCVINQLHGGATDSTIAASGAKIMAHLRQAGMASTAEECRTRVRPGHAGPAPDRWSPGRWRPALPNDYTVGPFDAAMGLPPNTPTTFR
jgi:hypothetical protein